MCANRCRRLLNLRLFENAETGRAWDKSVKDAGLEVQMTARTVTWMSRNSY